MVHLPTKWSLSNSALMLTQLASLVSSPLADQDLNRELSCDKANLEMAFSQPFLNPLRGSSAS